MSCLYVIFDEDTKDTDIIQKSPQTISMTIWPANKLSDHSNLLINMQIHIDIYITLYRYWYLHRYLYYFFEQEVKFKKKIAYLATR